MPVRMWSCEFCGLWTNHASWKEWMSHLVKLATLSFMDASHQLMICYKFSRGVPCVLGKRRGWALRERNPLISIVSELEKVQNSKWSTSLKLIRSNFCKSVVGIFQNPRSYLFSILRKLEKSLAICSLKIDWNTKAAAPTYCFCKTFSKLQTRV